MAIFIHDDKSLQLDMSNLGIKETELIKKLWTLFEEHGIDLDSASTGVNPSPDLGYFELSDRFWRGALSIYFAGFCKAFIEAGAGFLEPWLFNSRHSIELSLKGCLLYADWYEELIRDSLARGRKARLDKINLYHTLYDIYLEYENKIRNISKLWDSDRIGAQLDIDKLLLSKHGQDILNEISEADPNSFRFRYPSLKDADKSHKLQKMSWHWDKSGIYPITGLPRRPGVAFTHVKVMNAFHDLVREFSNIRDYHESLYYYLDELQGLAYEGL